MYSSRVAQAGSADYKALKNEAMRGTFVRVVNEDLTPYLSGIKAPSLLVYGRGGYGYTVKLAEIMEEKNPRCGVSRFGKCGAFLLSRSICTVYEKS